MMPCFSSRAWRHLQQAADGKATKIIIPSDIQGMAGLVTSVAEIAKNHGWKAE